MHLPHLTGLISLAGYAVASPTPANAGVQAPKRLVLYSEDNFQGISYEIEATNRCVKLESPIYKNLHSYGVVHQICYFMDTDSCTSKALITANAQGTASWGRVDVGAVNGYVGRIASVYCVNHPVSRADTVSVKRTDNIELGRRDGPGETTICRSTIDIGPCETLSANSACVAFGDELRHNIRNVYQAAGSICRYYDGACDEDSGVVEVNSYGGPVHMPCDKETGDRIDRVRCQPQWLAAAGQDGSMPIVPRLSDAPVIEAMTPRTLSTRNDWSYLFIYHDTNFRGQAYGIYSGYGCLSNPWGKDAVESLEVAKGYQCVFYQADHCQSPDGPPYYVDAASSGDNIRISDVVFDVRSFYCRPEPYNG
jgi:hypothetical protein